MIEHQFTIGIPVTRTRFLSETLASLVAQNDRGFEVQLVDNCADGDVTAIVAQFPSLAIRLLRRTKQMAPVENWNELLSHVTTRWFILLSDDDYLDPDHIQELRRLLEKYPQVGVAHTRVRVVDENRQTRFITATAAEWESAVDFLWHRINGHRIQFLSDFAWRVDALRAVRGFQQLPQAWGTDDLTAFLVGRKGGLAYAQKATFNYRVHQSSITQTAGVAQKMQAIDSLISIYRHSLEEIDLSHEGRLDELRLDTLNKLPVYRRNSQAYLLSNAGWGDLLTAILLPSRFSQQVALARGVPFSALFRKIAESRRKAGADGRR